MHAASQLLSRDEVRVRGKGKVVPASAASSTAGSSRVAATSRLLRLRSDDQLVEAFRQGHDAAFQVIHDHYRPRLFAYARQMLGGSPQDAEDAVQDVFLRAYHALRTDARPLTLRAWLYRVAHNRCIDQMRRPAPTPVEASEDTPSPAVDPLMAAQQREDLRRLVTDIRALPEQQRSALLMREMDGMSYTELGAALGTTVPAVKSLLVRARMGLAEAGEARDAACQEVRADLADSQDRGVRSSGRARRHMRECGGCRAYRVSLKGASAGIAALTPTSPGLLAGLAHALGLGGAGSGALVAGPGGAGAVGSGAAAAVGVTTTKVAAVLGAAAVAAGGATQAQERLASASKPVPSQAASPPPPAPSMAAAAGTPDAVLRSREAEETPKKGKGDKREGSGEEGTDASALADGVAGTTGGAGGWSAGGGGSGGGSSSAGEGKGEPREAKRPDRPVDRVLGVPGEVVGGVLDTVRRTSESVGDGSGRGSAGATGGAASNDPAPPPESRPRGEKASGG